MSDAAGYAMASKEQYEEMRREVADAAAAEDRSLRREAAIERLTEGETVEYDGEKWRLIGITPDGRCSLETWDRLATVEPTAVTPVR